MNEEKNYHSRLLGLSKTFDNIIEVIKNSYIDQKYNNWFVWLLTSPVRDLKQIHSLMDLLKKILAIPVVTTLISIVSFGYLTNANTFISTVIGFLCGYFIY